MKRTANTAIAVLAVLALLVVWGCGGDEDPAAQTASEPAGQSQAQGSPSAPAKDKGKGSEFAEERAAAEAAIEGKPAPQGTAGKAAGKKGPSIKPPKGPQEPAPTPRQRAESTLASMTLSSPVLQPGPESISPLPTTYSCKGKNVPPPLSWQGVPPGTRELVLFVLNLEPVNEALFFDWAVAGIDPALSNLESSQRLPQGAIPGRNGFGKLDYSLCPQKEGETVLFALYALPSPSGAKRGFDPMALRKEVLDRSGNAGILAVSF